MDLGPEVADPDRKLPAKYYASKQKVLRVIPEEESRYKFGLRIL